MYLNEKEVGEMLNLKLSKLRMDRQAGIGIPFYKFGKTVRYKIEDIETYVEKGKRQTKG